MHTALIVAAADNGIIGRDNQLPWRLPADLAYFKAMTLGKPVIMGRKTYDSIGRPLPGRPNIVVTRDPAWQPAPEYAQAVGVAGSVEQALAMATGLAMASGGSEIMVIGGAEIYRRALTHADRIYLTRVHADISGDASFPGPDLQQWRLVSREYREADASNEYPHSFMLFERVTKS
jgi:dihydrofolate reductase